MNRRKILLIVASVLALVVLLLWLQGTFHCHKISPEDKKASEEEVFSPSERYVVKKRDIMDWQEAVGTVESRNINTVSSKIQAYIIDIKVEAGDSVKRGDLLIKLDARDARTNYEKAKKEYERYKSLVERGGVSRQQFEAVRASYINARTALDHTTLKAPISGVVVDKRVQRGDLAVPGRPLLNIHDPGDLRLKVAVREGLEGLIKVGDRVKVRIDALNKDMEGLVEEVIPHADPASRSYIVRVGLPKIEGLQSGMFGRLYFAPRVQKAIAIPASYIRTVGQLETVFVYKNGRARVCYIRTGKRFGDYVEVLSGIEEGDTVIIK